MQERETLKKLKQIWYDNSKKVSPIWAGIVIGGIVGGAIGYQPAQNVDPVIRAVAASFVCALLGLGMGLAYNNVWGLKDFLYRLPPQWRLPTIILGVVLSVGIGYALYQVYPFRTPAK